MPLTTSQSAGLASLSPDQRERFAAISPEDQARWLEPHRLGFDKIMANEAAKVLGPQRDPPPEVPIPATTPELWARLPGVPRHWTQIAAESVVQSFGTERDRKLWPAFHGLAVVVWKGYFPVAAVLDAYRQGMKPEVRKPGAVFNAALQRNHGWGVAYG